MEILEMFYDKRLNAVEWKVSSKIPVGIMEYHARHAFGGTNSLVVICCLRELQKVEKTVTNPPV